MRTRRTSGLRPLSLLRFVLFLLFGPHCTAEQTNEPEGENPAAAPDGVVLSAASYELAWDTADVDFPADGGFSLTTNLGYRVHITEGLHVAHGVSLAQCEAPAASEASSLWGFGIRQAFAHTEEEDPSALEPLVITDLTNPPDTVFLGDTSFAPARYCKVFFLLARGMPGAATEDGLDMSNRSLSFTGTWDKDGAAGIVDIDTWWPKGNLADLSSVVPRETFDAAREDSAVRFAFVTIHVPLGKAFDDVDFAADSAAVLTDRVIENLTAGAKFSVDLRAP